MDLIIYLLSCIFIFYVFLKKIKFKNEYNTKVNILFTLISCTQNKVKHDKYENEIIFKMVPEIYFNLKVKYLYYIYIVYFLVIYLNNEYKYDIKFRRYTFIFMNFHCLYLKYEYK